MSDELYRSVMVNADRSQVFDFFASARNLEELTPPWLRFTIQSPQVEMAVGARIQYGLKVRGIPLRWESEITAWEPPYYFEDTQVRGPYRSWVHGHRFEVVGSGTKIIDHVRYDVPGGGIVRRLFVHPDLKRIFDFRQKKMLERFGAYADAEEAPSAESAEAG